MVRIEMIYILSFFITNVFSFGKKQIYEGATQLQFIQRMYCTICSKRYFINEKKRDFECYSKLGRRPFIFRTPAVFFFFLTSA